MAVCRSSTGPSTAALTYGYNAQNRNITGINLSDQGLLGVNNITESQPEQVEVALPAGVTLCNARGVHDASTAELVVGLIIAALGVHALSWSRRA